MVHFDSLSFNWKNTILILQNQYEVLDFCEGFIIYSRLLDSIFHNSIIPNEQELLQAKEEKLIQNEK